MIKNHRLCFFFCFAFLNFYPFLFSSVFIPTRTDLEKYSTANSIMIASTGRSGSDLLTISVANSSPEILVLKSHLLPRDFKNYRGKILFIFSNPDQAAESALHMTIKSAKLGSDHFYNVKTSNREWLRKIGGTTHQTWKDNLLAYDALGIAKHLKVWLRKTTRSSPQDAQILAIKYENLWELATIQAIQEFIGNSNFALPPRKERGYTKKELTSKEKRFRKYFNLGTTSNPHYKAYDRARAYWKKAPPLQYLRIN